MSFKRSSLDRDVNIDRQIMAVDGHVTGRSPSKIVEALRAGREVSDYSFDRFLPDALRLVSGQYWTPIEVAMIVAQWLEDAGVERVVDIGSGAGKLCVVGALTCGARFVGIEQRPRLVAAATNLARTFGVDDRVEFICGDLDDVELPETDAYYLYNPFGENLFGSYDRLDDEVELSRDRFMSDVTFVHRMLENAPVGTHLVTYNGFGGFVPAAYRELRCDLELPNVLRMWRKESFPE